MSKLDISTVRKISRFIFFGNNLSIDDKDFRIDIFHKLQKDFVIFISVELRMYSLAYLFNVRVC